MYDVLEVAAMRHKVLHVTVEGKERTIKVQDIFAKGSEEFLSAVEFPGNESIILRLDQIELIYDPSDQKSYVPNQC